MVKSIDKKHNRLFVSAGGVLFSILVVVCLLLFSENGTSELHKCVTVETVSGSASGFFVRMDDNLYVATCNHVVEGQPFAKVLDMEGVEYHASVVYCCSDRDLAFIQLSASNQLHRPVFKLQKKVEQLELSLPLYCLGDSEGKGVVVRSEGKILGVGPTTIETDATIVPGNSGGPVVLKRSGKVIGAASHLTNNSGRWKWTKGTRFDNAIRKFAVRLDNIDRKTFSQPTTMVRPDDYEAIVDCASKCEDLDLRIACYLYAAEHGNARAQYNIALVYLTNGGLEREGENRQKALNWLEKAADQNELDALNLLAICYHGTKIKSFRVDEEKAFGLFLRAAKLGSASAMAEVGNMYCLGLGVSKDEEKGWSWIEKSAEEGNPGALLNLGKRYHFGIGVTASAHQARTWYNRALKADQQDADQYGTGNIRKGELNYLLGLLHYQGGAGVSANPQLALQYLQRAVDSPDFSGNALKTDCLALIAKIHYEMPRSEEHDKAAFDALMVAAKAGNAESQRRLAICYRQGRGVGINKEESISWYLKAANGGDAEAQEQTGLDWEDKAQAEDNRFIRQDKLKTAIKWFRSAAENGKPFSQWKLGELYYSGNGVDRDYEIAFFWYKKSAEQGYAPAMKALARCYSKGMGCPMNKDRALEWLRKTTDKKQDSDLDGIPDLIEMDLGLDFQDRTDASGDLDGDGFSNLEEFRAKTDPKKSSSHPARESFLRVSKIQEKRFPYTLQKVYGAAGAYPRFQFSHGIIVHKGEPLWDTDYRDTGYIVSDYNIHYDTILQKDIISVTLKKGQTKLVLQEGGPAPPMHGKYTVSLVCLRDENNMTFTLERGESFTFYGKRYILTEIDPQNERVVIKCENTGKTFTISKR